MLAPQQKLVCISIAGVVRSKQSTRKRRRKDRNGFLPGRNELSIRVSAHENLQCSMYSCWLLSLSRCGQSSPKEYLLDKKRTDWQNTTHSAPAEAGPTALNSDMNVIEIPLATPL
jgi:hypothetical protein